MPQSDKGIVGGTFAGRHFDGRPCAQSTGFYPHRALPPTSPLHFARRGATPLRQQCLQFIHRREPWRSFEAVEFATLEWVDWFNNRRLLEPIGSIPPAEAEERYYAMTEQPAMAA